MSIPNRDDSRQRLMGCNGGLIDTGAVEFDLNETTVTVNTKLSYVNCAHGTTEQGKLVCTAPDGVVENNQITFTRANGDVAGDTLHYTLYGY